MVTDGVASSEGNGTLFIVNPASAVKLTVLLPIVSWIVAVSLSIANAKTASSTKSALRGRVPVLQVAALGKALYQKTTSSVCVSC